MFEEKYSDPVRSGLLNSFFQAIKYGMEKHPDAPAEHHAAFANAVLITQGGWSGGGIGGPSMRESWALSKKIFGSSFEEAVLQCEEVCYGPMTLEIASMYDDLSVDDTEEDVREALSLRRSL